MRLLKVSRTASAVGRLVAAPAPGPRVEPAQRAEAPVERRQPLLRRRLPDRQPDGPTARGTYLNLIV